MPVSDFFESAEKLIRENPATLAHLTTPHAVRLLQAYAEVKDRTVQLAIVNLVEGIVTQSKA